MKEKDKNQLSEPEIAYRKKRIQFFKSHEEEEEATLRDRMRMTPEQRLAMVTAMLEQLYEEELSRPRKYNRIIFDHLIISKLLSDRPQDKADVEVLQKSHRLKSKEDEAI